MIAGKYGFHRGGWFLVEARRPYGVCFWRNIRNVWEDFSNFVSFEVGMGAALAFGMMFGAEKLLSRLYF